MADPTAERDTEKAQRRTSDSGPYDAKHNVHHKPHLALHELLREPAGDPADNDLMLFRWRFLPATYDYWGSLSATFVLALNAGILMTA